MNRFTIGGLMALILVYAVGLAALRSANELWAGIMLMIALAAVGVAVLGAICLRDKHRFWWIGFAVFESGYLILAFGPWCATEIQPKLATTLLLRYVHDQAVGPQPSISRNLARSTMQTNTRPRPNSVGSINSASVTYPTYKRTASPPPFNRWRSLLPGAVNYDLFLPVGHSMFALLAGLIGGAIASWFHAMRERGETPRASSGVV